MKNTTGYRLIWNLQSPYLNLLVDFVEILDEFLFLLVFSDHGWHLLAELGDDVRVHLQMRISSSKILLFQNNKPLHWICKKFARIFFIMHAAPAVQFQNRGELANSLRFHIKPWNNNLFTLASLARLMRSLSLRRAAFRGRACRSANRSCCSSWKSRRLMS